MASKLFSQVRLLLIIVILTFFVSGCSNQEVAGNSDFSEDVPESKLELLTKKSYPVVGYNWVLDFNTTGVDDLFITMYENTTWSHEDNETFQFDLQFLELLCGDKQISDLKWANGGIYLDQYSCDETTYLVNKVHTYGGHAIAVQFGNQVEVGYNDASVYEAGTIQTFGWTSVNTVRTYIDPIVVAFNREGFEVSADAEVATAIVRSITSSSFEVQLRIEGAVQNGNVSYIVVENGSHEMTNGMLLQAGRFDPVSNYDANSENAASWNSIVYWDTYGTAPAVIAAPNNDSANDWVSVRYDSGTLGTSSVSISLELDNSYGNAPVAASPTNSIGWIAMNRTSAEGMEAAEEASVDEDPGAGDFRTISFTNTYTTPIFFGLQEQAGGTDPCKVGHQSLSGNGVDIRVTEERTDGEQNHATEDVQWMVFEATAGNNVSTTPTNITCNDLNNCNVTIDNYIVINASGSTDDENNTIEYHIEASFPNSTVTPDQEPDEFSQFGQDGRPLGETGITFVEDFVWQWVDFSRVYNRTPILITTAASDNAAEDNPWVPAVDYINESGFNVTMCKDIATANCDLTTSQEEVHWMAWDIDALETEEVDWIAVGNTSEILPNGADNTLTWGKTLSTSTPYVVVSAQTYNQTPFGRIAAHAWVDQTGMSSTQATGFAPCTHQGTSNTCDAATGRETYGFVAIDPTNVDLESFQSGEQNIAHSTWTSVGGFSPSYTNPVVAVLQNDDDGSQDPQYPWARNVGSSNMDIRYCEHDGLGDCDTHNDEITVWWAMEEGSISRTDAPLQPDLESEKDFETYNDVFEFGWKEINLLNVTIYISVYDTAGSTANGNNDPDLELQMFNGSGWVPIQNLSLSGTGNNTITITEPSVLEGWKTPEFMDLRFRGVDFDYNDIATFDEINWTDVIIGFNGTMWSPLGSHIENGSFFWNTTYTPKSFNVDLRTRSRDPNGSNSYSEYYEKGAALNISHDIDLEPQADQITINETNPLEGENYTISVNVTNAAIRNVTNVIVSFFDDGEPLGNQTINITGFNSTITNITWTAQIGSNNITVAVDPNNLYNETDETNNNASTLVNISIYQTVLLNFDFNVSLTGGLDNALYVEDNTSGILYVMVMDDGSNVDFSSMQALGYTINGADATDDFNETDQLLGNENASDSFLHEYGDDDEIAEAPRNLSFYDFTISHVPTMNTTQSASPNFFTGILWDTTDDTGNLEFDTTDQEDLVFIGNYNQSRVTEYGVADAVVKFPATLVSYKDANNIVEIYVVLK